MIVFDASTIVGAALKSDGVPARALLRAEEVDVFALSTAVEAEIVDVLNRPKFANLLSPTRRHLIMRILRVEAVRFEPA